MNDKLNSYLTTGTEIETRKTDPETGGMKGSKLAQLGALDPATLYHLAEVAGAGADKYTAHNFMKGYDYSLSYDAAQRHLLKFWMGENVDPESGQLHLMHAAWHCLALAGSVLRGTGTDNRPPAFKLPTKEPKGKPLQLSEVYGGGEAGVGDTVVIYTAFRNNHVEGIQKISALPDDFTFQIEGDCGIYRRKDYEFTTLPGDVVEVGKRYRFTSRRRGNRLLNEDSHLVTAVEGSKFATGGTAGWYLDLWKAELIEEEFPAKVEAGKTYRLTKIDGRVGLLTNGIYTVTRVAPYGTSFYVNGEPGMYSTTNYEFEEIKVGDRLKSEREYDQMPVYTRFSDSLRPETWYWELQSNGDFINPFSNYSKYETARGLHSFGGMKVVALGR